MVLVKVISSPPPPPSPAAAAAADDDDDDDDDTEVTKSPRAKRLSISVTFLQAECHPPIPLKNSIAVTWRAMVYVGN